MNSGWLHARFENDQWSYGLRTAPCGVELDQQTCMNSFVLVARCRLYAYLLECGSYVLLSPYLESNALPNRGAYFARFDVVWSMRIVLQVLWPRYWCAETPAPSLLNWHAEMAVDVATGPHLQIISTYQPMWGMIHHDKRRNCPTRRGLTPNPNDFQTLFPTNWDTSVGTRWFRSFRRGRWHASKHIP